jgi:hypothetical protein
LRLLSFFACTPDAPMSWKRKPTPPNDGGEPRPHHYAFAHLVLREACAADPLRFFATMASPERCRFMAALWEGAARHVGRPVEGFDPNEASVTTCRIGERATVVVAMPAPRAVAEAHFVALVLEPLPRDFDAAHLPAFRCFTLEHGRDIDSGAARTVLCEWADDAHRNFGDGPAPRVEGFIAAIGSLLAAPGDPR